MDDVKSLFIGLLLGFMIGFVIALQPSCITVLHDTSAGIYIDYKKDLYKLEKVTDKEITK